MIRRFDLAPDGGYLGFEDAASLTGRHPRDKYHANYADVARAIADFCAVRHRTDSLERFFRQLVFCCLIRNGNAHLKNWGLLYGDPASAGDDARLSPVYDLACTVVWIPRDTLALKVVERALGFHPASRTRMWKAIRAQTELAAGTLGKA